MSGWFESERGWQNIKVWECLGCNWPVFSRILGNPSCSVKCVRHIFPAYSVKTAKISVHFLLKIDVIVSSLFSK
jgi:hypothetical protein